MQCIFLACIVFNGMCAMNRSTGQSLSQVVTGYICLSTSISDCMVYTGYSGIEECKKIFGITPLPTEPSVRVWVKKNDDINWHLGIHSLFEFKDIHYQYIAYIPFSILEPFITQKAHSITFKVLGKTVQLFDEKLTRYDSSQEKTVAETLYEVGVLFQSLPLLYELDKKQFMQDEVIVQLPTGYYARGKNGWKYPRNVVPLLTELLFFIKEQRPGQFLKHNYFFLSCNTESK